MNVPQDVPWAAWSPSGEVRSYFDMGANFPASNFSEKQPLPDPESLSVTVRLIALDLHCSNGGRRRRGGGCNDAAQNLRHDAAELRGPLSLRVAAGGEGGEARAHVLMVEMADDGSSSY